VLKPRADTLTAWRYFFGPGPAAVEAFSCEIDTELMQ
jgi:hypothetical protein